MYAISHQHFLYYFMLDFSFVITLVLIVILISFGIALLFIKVPNNPLLQAYRSSRKWVAISLFLIALANVHHLFNSSDFLPDDAILDKLAFLIASAYLALLYCTTLTRMMSPYLKDQPKVYIELIIISFFSISCILIYVAGYKHSVVYQIIFYLFLLWYVIQMIRYTFVFRNAYRALMNMLENYYSDDIVLQTRWILRLSLIALLFAYGCITGVLIATPTYILISHFFVGIFHIYFSIGIINYGIRFAYIEEAISEKKITSVATTSCCNNTHVHIANNVDKLLAEKIELWIRHKGFTNFGITIQTLADMCGSNRTYISQYINRNYRQSYYQWINKLRIDYACCLMQSSIATNYSFEEIGKMSGYVDKSNFTKQFTKIMGVSPSVYHKNISTDLQSEKKNQ